jgi:cation diffusion facilitator family transporter
MSKFPENIPLPKSIQHLRVQRRRQMVRTARRGVAARCAIILAELLGFAFLNSATLLVDALSTLVDVASSLCLIFFIKLADKPPDEEHPFGHGRFEPIAGLQLGLILAALGAVMLFQQISALLHGQSNRTIDPHTWIIALCAVVLLEICYRVIKHTAVRENSPALLAEAVHYRIDGANSLFAMVALLFAAFFPKYGVAIDHMGAIIIACLMIVIGGFAAKNNIHQLLDRTPDKKYFNLVREAAMGVSGILGTEKLRLQVYGPDAHVSIDVEVDPSLSVEVAHGITQKVRAEIQKAWPAVRDVIVHVEPYYANDH